MNTPKQLDPLTRYQIVDSGYACPVGLVDDFEALRETVKATLDKLPSDGAAWDEAHTALTDFSKFIRKNCVEISDGFTFQNPSNP